MRRLRQFKRYYQSFAAVIALVPAALYAADTLPIQVETLLKTGQELAEKSHYLEALDLLDEARDTLETNDSLKTSIYADVLFTLAQTKIKGRLHQNFPAHYVKTALQDIQAANRLRERLPEILPQRLAEGYYLEGYIQKRFFMRADEALACFTKAVKVDPGLGAAKRELSGLVSSEESGSK